MAMVTMDPPGLSAAGRAVMAVESEAGRVGGKDHTGIQVESAPEGRMTRISSRVMTAVEREKGRMEEGKEKE
jgi:hypothetical protein